MAQASLLATLCASAGELQTGSQEAGEGSSLASPQTHGPADSGLAEPSPRCSGPFPVSGQWEVPGHGYGSPGLGWSALSLESLGVSLGGCGGPDHCRRDKHMAGAGRLI